MATNGADIGLDNAERQVHEQLSGGYTVLLSW
jgi:hypothetical protein